MNHQEVRKRFLEVVDEEARRGGRGTVARAESVAGLRRGWLYDMRRRDHIELAEALSFAEALGLAGSELAGRMTSGRSGPLKTFLCRVAALPTEPPALIAKAQARFESGDHTPAPAAEGGRLRNEIERLDELRYERAEAALAQIEKLVNAAIGFGDAELTAEALGVWASCHRILGQLERAQQALAVGLKIADHHGCEHTRVSLAQRASYVIRDLGDFERGMELNEWAILRYQELGDLTGMGRATVDKAIQLVCQDRNQEAIHVFETALMMLPEDARRYRFAALQGLGRANLLTGNLEAAERYTALAEEFATQRSGHTWGHLSWLRAGIAVRRRRFDEAEALYQRTLEVFEAIPEPFVVALVTVELVRWQLVSGRRRAAVETATRMTALLEHLDRYRVVSAAIMDLVAAARLGSLTVELTEQVARAIERGRSNATARSARKEEH